MHYHFDHSPEGGERKLSSFALMRRLWPFMRGHLSSFSMAVLLLLLAATAELAGPLILRKVIDTAIPSRSVGMIGGLSALFAGTFLVSIVLAYLQVIIATRIGLSVVRDLKEKVFTHMLTLSQSFFDAHPSGKLMARVESDAERVRMLFSDVSMALLRNVAMVAGTLTIMFVTNTRITTWVVLLIIPVSLMTVPVLGHMRKLYFRVRQSFARIAGFVSEYVRAVPVLQVFGATGSARNKLHAEGVDFLRREVRAYFWEYGFWSFLGSCEIAAVIVILFSGRGGVVAGTVTVGTVVLFVEYTRRLFGPIVMFSETLNQVQRAMASAERLFEILTTETLTPDGTLGEDEFPRDWKEIRFQNVWFRYADDADWALRDVSFILPRGCMIALVGNSGGGKSTIVSLLLRFYQPQKGSITVDGIDISDLQLDVWRGRLGLVLQNVSLFSGTLSGNLTVFDDTIGEDKQVEALRTIEAEDLLVRIPGGLKGEISEGGSNLSMGERQLVNFARAVLRRPEILILDEATSSVDPGTEKRIQRSTDLLISGRTALVVAHRLSTVIHASKILVVQHGRIEEEGTHGELIAAKGVYAGLCRLQFGEEVTIA
jgi:ATP-binding cassette subfamily B multidrug efflux pump